MRPRYMTATRSEMCCDDAEVVAHEKVGEAESSPQLHEQVEHLGLDRDVERGGRFVADEHGRPHRERACDADAGALAAGELVRITAARRRIEADDRHHLGDIGFHLGCVDEAVDDGCLADDLDDPPARIEGGHRVLEDHLDGRSTLRRSGPASSATSLPLDIDAPCGRLEDAGDDAAERRFAAARIRRRGPGPRRSQARGSRRRRRRRPVRAGPRRKGWRSFPRRRAASRNAC